MHVNVDIVDKYSNEDIDISELFALDHVTDSDELATALKLAVAKVAIDYNVGFDKIDPDYIEGDDSSDGLSIIATPGIAWVEEVAKFAWHVLNDPDNDEGVYFAYVSNEHWNQFDFDDMSDIDDNFQREFDGDYADYAREWMSEMGESLPDHLENHFDYEAYGESLLDGENVIEWGYCKYIFSE